MHATPFARLVSVCVLVIANAPLLAAPAGISPQLAAHAANRNAGLPELALDFTRACVLAAPSPGPESKAVALLVDETARRTLVRWPVVAKPGDAQGAPLVVTGVFSQIKTLLRSHPALSQLNEDAVRAEGYQIITPPAAQPGGAPLLIIAGKDARGVLFGIGHFLRKLHMGPARAGLMQPLNITTSPRYPLRGHQLGYRPKPNSYSGWDIRQWERYICELAMFGANAIELVPPRTDDAPDSPHFPEPQLDMMTKMSRLCADYGLDCWIWYPALDKDYGDPDTVTRALEEWGNVFRALPRIDAVLVPGGDPGHTPPRILMPFVEKQTQNLRTYHPAAAMWMSPQGFTAAEVDYFFDYINKNQPAWLAGAVYAPQNSMGLDEFRRRLPKRYAVRHYPDITHTRTCQYPVNEWDCAFSITAGREPVCPRPLDMQRIVSLFAPYTIGALTYSEGCTDDVNKTLFSALHWDPEAPLVEILRDYARLYINERLADDFAHGQFALERNWRGPLLTNGAVPVTLAQFQDMERSATPGDLRNWRFQMALYRAYYDAYIQQRLLYETGLETEALSVLRQAADMGSLPAMSRAEEILARAKTHPVGLSERTRAFQLAEALFQTVNMKLSVPQYRAIAQNRGANLDSIDWPLNNRPWLLARFAGIRALASETDRLALIGEIVRWTDPGPGGFYDDLGKPHLSPHLVCGQGNETDPGFIHTVMTAFHNTNPAVSSARMSWMDQCGVIGDNAVTLRYTDLDPSAQYQVKATYFMTSERRPPVALVANGTLAVRTWDNLPEGATIDTVDLPSDATQTGTLTLAWKRPDGWKDGNPRGLVAEVWLIKKSPAQQTGRH